MAGALMVAGALSPALAKVGWTEMAVALMVAGALSPAPAKVG
jgi:hypothetical protein